MTLVAEHPGRLRGPLLDPRFQMLAVQLPFRMPSALAELATWAGALFNIDFGQVASPECSMADSDPGTISRGRVCH